MVSKKTICKGIADDLGMSEKKVTEVVNAFIEGIKKNVSAGETVTAVGFGTFKQTERAARTGRNPSTGATITIPASKSVKFKASDAFKATL